MSGGYVTDTTYVAEFYGDHSPVHLNFIAAANGFRPRPLDEPFTWCDYGCGNGVTANLLAAAHPEGHFYGVDFLPAHIRTAQVLATRGALDNTTFIEKSFTALADKDIPPLDFAVMHGVLSWVDEATRDAVLADAAKRLKPGGLLMTGTNTLPGWAAKLPMRNMIFSLTPDHENSLARADAGLKWLQKLKAAEVKYFRDNPAIAEAVDELARLDPRYMAHEYFNVHLRPFYFAELNALVSRHGLKCAGSTTMFLNMVDLAVPAALQDEFRAAKSRVELEAKRDFIRNETFRRDLWIKGEEVTGEDEWLALNESLIFGTLQPLAKIDREVSFGEIQLRYDSGPLAVLLEAVATQAISVADMAVVPGLDGLSREMRIDAARLLAAGGQVVPFALPTEAVKVPKDAQLVMSAINRGIIKELALHSPRVPLCAPAAGSAVHLSNIDAVLLQAICDKGREDEGLSVAAKDGPIPYASRLMGADKGDMKVQGRVLKPEEIEPFLGERLATFETTMLDKLVEVGVVDLA